MTPKFILIIVLLFVGISSYSQKIQIVESKGWLETAIIKWQPIDSAKSYKVYYSTAQNSKVFIDQQLIRNYNSFVRADILGLKAGKYSFSIVPVFSGGDGEASQTDSFLVSSYDRSGYGFWNSRVPGAYKQDGSPKDNAVIIYITENTKNKVQLSVTGATANPCIGLQTILDGYKKGKETRPLIVRFIGQISDPSYTLNGDIVIENAQFANSFITFEGIGNDALVDGWGLRIKNASNVEVRNLGFMNCNSSEGDDLGLQQDNDHIWVHNCDFFYGAAGSDADQLKGDGALDCKKSTYVTFSYNHFWDTGKSNLLGLSEDDTTSLFITYHHNWYDHSDSRHPRVRFYSAHVYNNYYDGNSKYGVGATEGSSVFVEANYFRNCKYPMLISMQGSDVYDASKGTNDYSNMPTFSKEDGGMIKAYNNYMSGQHRYVSYGASGYPNSTVDFDAVEVTSRNDTVSKGIKTYQGSHRYNNFDTNTALIYTYSVDSPEVAKNKVVEFSGRSEGGDFKWTFNNSVDDASYDINTGLKTALTNYKTLLVSVQGDSIPDGNGGGTTDTTTNAGSEPGDMIQNFTVSGLLSNFYAISGNLSDSKGTVSYLTLTLTQCLKMETATSITFSTIKEGTLTMVFNSTFTGKVKVDGINYNATSGIVSLTLQPGTHSILKGDAANLYYISVIYSGLSSIYDIKKVKIKIYPNPVSSVLKIETDNNIELVELYSVNGDIVYKHTGIINEIDLKNISVGTYLLKVMTWDGSNYYQKIIKK